MRKTLVTLLFILLLPVADAKEDVDISDPMAVYTGGSLTGGNEGLGASFQFGLNSGNWGLLGNFEAKSNLDTYRARIFTPNKKTGTGIYIDAGTDSSDESITANYATLGVLQVVPLSKKLRLYAGITYGKAWEKNEKFQDTKIVSVQSYFKYDLNDDFYLMLNPQYTYGLDGENTRQFYMAFLLGFHIDKDRLIFVETTSDNEISVNFKFQI